MQGLLCLLSKCCYGTELHLLSHTISFMVPALFLVGVGGGVGYALALKQDSMLGTHSAPELAKSSGFSLLQFCNEIWYFQTWREVLSK